MKYLTYLIKIIILSYCNLIFGIITTNIAAYYLFFIHYFLDFFLVNTIIKRVLPYLIKLSIYYIIGIYLIVKISTIIINYWNKMYPPF